MEFTLIALGIDIRSGASIDIEENVMISQRLEAHVASSFAEQRVIDVRIGLGYTAVQIEDGNVGVAYTFRDDSATGCSVFMGKRPLAGSSAGDLLDYFSSDVRLESTVGLAVINALSNRKDPEQEEGDLLESLALRANDRVGMVGFFGPLVGPIEQRVRELVIFERDPRRSPRVRPAEAAHQELPDCDVALISSTALIGGGMDALLTASGDCREVVLVGASTPLVPEIFGHCGVTMLSGITVEDGPGILQIVSEGGGMGFFGRRVRKVNIRL